MARRDALQLAKHISAECGRRYRVWLHDPGWLILHEVDAGLRHWYWWETDEPINSDANRERLARIIRSEHVTHAPVRRSFPALSATGGEGRGPA